MTKDQWSSLNGKQQWDCIVALRGPDLYGSETIKYFTTGVIRNAMAPIMRVGGQLSNLDFVCLPSGRVFKPAKEGGVAIDLNHFVQHVWEAAQNLDIPIVAVPSDLWEKLVNAPYREAMKLLSGWAVDHIADLPPPVAKRLAKNADAILKSAGEL